MSGKNRGCVAASHDTGMRVSGEPCAPDVASSIAPMLKTISAETSTPAIVTRSSAATERARSAADRVAALKIPVGSCTSASRTLAYG